MQCPCGFHSTRVKHSGRRRAPPGSTTRPCQELADDPRVYFQTPAVASLVGGCGDEEPKRDDRTAAGHLGRKRGRRRKSTQWRAARRPPCLATDTDTIGLRLSARHPLIRGTSSSTPDAEMRRGDVVACLLHSSCPDLIRASMPLPLSKRKRRWNGLPAQARQ